MRWLDLSHNQLTGTLPTDWKRRIAQRFVVLHVQNNQLEGNLLPALGYNNSRIYSLYIQNNDFTGTLPAFPRHGTKIEELQLHNTKITGIDQEFCETQDSELVFLKAACDVCTCFPQCYMSNPECDYDPTTIVTHY